jgi:hypothetical protein
VWPDVDILATGKASPESNGWFGTTFVVKSNCSTYAIRNTQYAIRNDIEEAFS